MNKVLSSRKSICNKVLLAIEMALDTAEPEAELECLEDEVEQARARVEASVSDNAGRAQDQAEYARQYQGLVEEYEAAALKARDAQSEIKRRRDAMGDSLSFIVNLEKAPRWMRELDVTLWHVLVDHAAVHQDGSVSITFRGGIEMGLAD